MDYERLSAEFLRAIRGKRSQTAFARRLGYRGNAVYTWEAGRSFPTAARAFEVAARAGIDVRRALRTFYRRAPEWLADADPADPATVARVLDDLRGRTPVVAVAAAAGRSRFRVARWLAGQTEPRLPDFLRMVEATSLRALDFVASFVDPAALPSAADAWRDLEATRRAAYEVPWTQAFLRALELSEYRALPTHEVGWLARRLGLSLDEERRCIALLERTGQIALERGRYVPARVLAVDTRRDPEAGRRVRQFWAEVAASRIAAGSEGTHAYNVFGVSRADLARLQELQTAYFREMRAIVARSGPVEVVALANLQLLPLG